jgi:ABC-type multidrug transport system ATPase subunit
LTGLIPPTSGWATVAGYDIRTQMNMVQLMIGVCPQFDCQWNELTVLEHILFYARLKVNTQLSLNHSEIHSFENSFRESFQ